MEKHLKIKVYGRVQGVSFRRTTKEEAVKLGLRGFVRNEDDSSVYIEVEGDREKVEYFLEWCREGPTLAIVEKIDIIEGDFRNFGDFSVLYFYDR